MEKGRDVGAPKRHVRFGDTEYELVFNNFTAMTVEDIYDERYGHPEKGYYDVLTELAVPKHRALMAVAYAAILAGGGKVTWEEFAEKFQLTDIVGLRETLQGAVLESLPEDDGKAAKAAKKKTTKKPATPGAD